MPRLCGLKTGSPPEPRAVWAAVLLLALGPVSGAAWAGPSAPATASPGRALRPADLNALREVSDPRISPDGLWVAYTVKTNDPAQDERVDDLWMTRWDGSQTVQLTFTRDNENQPRWSPDGKSLAFLSDRGDGEDQKTQVWLMDRAGGEARQLTHVPGGISYFAWSPDGRRLALIASDPDPEEAAAPSDKMPGSGTDEAAAGQEQPAGPDPGQAAGKQTPKPIVIDRYQFKEDVTGYLLHQRDHLYAFDLATAKVDQLTTGDFDDALPSWSPDGSRIAFSSKRGGDPDRHDNWDVFVIEARAGAPARPLTTFEGADNDPAWDSPAAWSPDGSQIAYLQGGPPKYRDYDPPQVAVIPAAGGEPRLLTAALDRWTTAPAWSADGRSVLFLLEDDRSVVVARIPAAGGAMERLTPPQSVALDFDLSSQGRLAVLETTALKPAEVMALEPAGLRPLSRQNDALVQSLDLGAVEGAEWKSADGTEIHGLLFKPPGYEAGRRYPTIVYIHGGPVAQDQFEFDDIRLFLSAAGYLVLAPNYRGSSGRGRDFSRAIYADWGHLEVQDVLAGVDALVARGLSDPHRLGIGGWSYGGMMTDYTIASDPRFKAAASGAGIANQITGYGVDQYVRQYEGEFGPPWKGLDGYLRTSYPFFRADRIKTPTLFLCGEQDFNVPLVNSEQMYQALRSLNVPTKLVIYPGQHHGLTKPSYRQDKIERYLNWFSLYLEPEAKPPSKP